MISFLLEERKTGGIHVLDKRCVECGVAFSTESSQVKYCRDHRRREKPLRKIEDIYECPTCEHILAMSEAGLGEAMGEVLELQQRTEREIRDSYERRLKTTDDKSHKPTRFDNHVETASWWQAEKLADKRSLTLKTMSEMTGLNRSSIRRHLDQHLIPLGYFRRKGRRIDAGPVLGQGLPRYHFYYSPEKTQWLPPFGFFGFTEKDIERSKSEFEKLNEGLSSASEDLVLFWLRTRLRHIEDEIQGVLNSEKTDIKTKALIQYGARLAINQELERVATTYLPIVSKSGKDLSRLRNEIQDIMTLTIGEKTGDCDRLRDLVHELEAGKSPLRKKSRAQVKIRDVARYIHHKLTFDMPTLIVDWKRQEYS